MVWRSFLRSDVLLTDLADPFIVNVDANKCNGNVASNADFLSALNLSSTDITFAVSLFDMIHCSPEFATSNTIVMTSIPLRGHFIEVNRVLGYLTIQTLLHLTSRVRGYGHPYLCNGCESSLQETKHYRRYDQHEGDHYRCRTLLHS